MTYTLTQYNLHIVDGYKVRKWNMRKELQAIKDKARPGTTIVFRRSFFSLKMEWISHNFLYRIGYKRTQTKDPDLDNPCERPEWQYKLFGLLVWIFVW